jgi:ribosomal protein S18 acetylase RimI-like enzyme
MITTRKATLEDLEDLSSLFNAYRVFYNQPDDLKGAFEFLKERFLLQKSVVLVAVNNNKMIGFTQLYPIFSSVSLKKAWLLNDLFIDSSARRLGAAEALLHAARKHGIETGSKWLLLETAHDNVPAQTLYVKNGWEKVEDVFYTLTL